MSKSRAKLAEPERPTAGAAQCGLSAVARDARRLLRPIRQNVINLLGQLVRLVRQRRVLISAKTALRVLLGPREEHGTAAE